MKREPTPSNKLAARKLKLTMAAQRRAHRRRGWKMVKTGTRETTTGAKYITGYLTRK